jgi:Ca2+-binding EF-hand superfamily protein
MKTIMTLSSAIALSLTVSATVAAAPDWGKGLAKKFDVNQDGSITRAEVLQVSSEKFASADTDGDGFLSADEMSTAHKQQMQQMAAKRFAEMDTDGNGSLSLEEFQAGKPPAGRKHGGRAEQKFSRLDRDGDGLVSAAELRRRFLRIFKRLDSNGDDVISAEEMSQKPARHSKPHCRK